MIPRFIASKCQKEAGSTLLIAIILSAIMMTIGLSAAKMIIHEVKFSTNFLFSEKAYFAAESGVEVALLELKANPVQHIKDYTVSLDTTAEALLNLKNKVQKFSFELAPNQSQKFRLLRDNKDDENYNGIPIDTFELKVTPNDLTKKYQWKILCKDTTPEKKTKTLVNNNGNHNISNFFQEDAHPSGELGLKNFNAWEGGIDNKTCFLFIQNTSTSPLTFAFENSTKMAPEKARINAVGKAGNREKTIGFDYYQTNLGSLFDFVLLHTDDGVN